MTTTDLARPIGRIVAHELSEEELDMVAGGSQCMIYTQTCSYFKNQACGDNPCCTQPVCD